MSKTAPRSERRKPRRTKHEVERDKIRRESWDLRELVDRSVLESVTQGRWPPPDDIELRPAPEPPETPWSAAAWQALLGRTEQLAEQWSIHAHALARAGQRAAARRADAIADVLLAVERVAGPRSTRRADMTPAQQRMNDACAMALRPASPEARARWQAMVDAEDDWLLATSASARKLDRRPEEMYEGRKASTRSLRKKRRSGRATTTGV